MAKRLPLDILTELARNRSNDAARQLGQLRSAHLGAREQLALLTQYRQDYLANLQTLMVQGLPSARWHNYQAFLATLDGAIEQQRAAVAQAESRVDLGCDTWRQHTRSQKSFDALAERARRRDQLTQTKREQHDNDERAARGHLARAASPMF